MYCQIANCQGKWFLSNLEHPMAHRADVVKALDIDIVITHWPTDQQLSLAARSVFSCPVCVRMC